MKAWIRIQFLNGKRVDMDVPICYCIITQVPFIPFFKNLLQRLLGSSLSPCQIAVSRLTM